MPDAFPNVKELSNPQLLDHWRRAAALWADIDGSKFSRQEVLDFAKFLIREIWKRDAATFNTLRQKRSTVDLFLEAAKDIAFDGLTLWKPHGQRVVAGEKKLIVKSKTFPGIVGRPVSLVSDSKIVGIITLTAPEELTEGEFEKRRAQHTITDEERGKWWGKKMPLWGYRLAVNAVFDPPIRLDTAQAARFIMKDSKTNVGLFEGLLPVYSSHEGDGAQSLELEDFTRFWNKPAILLDGCALAVGSCVTLGASDNDLDVVLRLPSREQLLDDMAFRLGRAVPHDELRKRIQFLSDRQNPITSYVPLYDLVMVPRPELKVFMMQMLRDAKLQREARASEADDAVRPDRMVFPIKPQRGAIEGQLQTIPNFLRLFSEKNFPLLASKKYDGVRHLVLKADSARIISDDGEDNTKRLPKLVKLFESIPGKFVVDIEIELWEEGRHLPREAAAGAVKRGDDKNLVANIFDALYWNGDIHKDSSFARHELLSRELAGRDFIESTLKAPTKPINLAPQLEAKDKEELLELTKRLSKEPGSEGIVAKSGPYELDGDSKTWWKYHLAAVAPVVVLRRIETKAKGIFNYLFGLAYDGDLELKRKQKLGDETFLVVGKTFNTAKRFQPGDVVDVEFETLNWIEEDGKLDVTFWVPSLIDRSKLKEPMEARAAAKLAERNRVLVRKRIEGGEIMIEQSFEAMEKRIEKLYDLEEQRGNPYLDFPKRNVPVPAMLHFHWRGKSVHGDIRALVNFSKRWPETQSVAEASKWVKGARQRGELSGHLVGWTLNLQKAGKVKSAVESLTAARGLVAGWSRDKGGRVLKSFVASGPGGIHLVTETKAREPIEWLNFEARVPKGAVGATKEREGILHIADRFWVKLGSQKPDFHEYFVTDGGKLNGRLVVRLLKNVFDPERAGRAKFVWMSWFTKAKLPFVLSKRAVEDRYLPPRKHSALPVVVEERVPGDLRYWRMDRAAALKARDLLVEKRLVREGDFGEKANGELTFKDQIKARRAELKEQKDHDFRFLVCCEKCGTPLGEDAHDIPCPKCEPARGGLISKEAVRRILAEQGFVCEMPAGALTHLRDACEHSIAETLGPSYKCKCGICESAGRTIPMGMLTGAKDIVSERIAEAIRFTKNGAVRSGATVEEIASAVRVLSGPHSGEDLKEMQKAGVLCEQEADFTYSRRTFKGPVVIRFGPSREEFHLYLKSKGRGLKDFVSLDSLLTNEKVSAILEELDDVRWLEFEGDIPPGAPGNPTKDTPAEQKILAQGQATILQDTAMFVKFELQSEELNGLFVAKRRKDEELWDVERSASVGEPTTSREASR